MQPPRLAVQMQDLHANLQHATSNLQQLQQCVVVAAYAAVLQVRGGQVIRKDNYLVLIYICIYTHCMYVYVCMCVYTRMLTNK